MNLRAVGLSTTFALASITVIALPSSPAAAACSAFGSPAYSGTVPTAEDVLGFRLGFKGTSPRQISRYIKAVDESSDRVISGVAATSVAGRPLPYAVVGDPANVTVDALRTISRDAQKLRNPKLSDSRVDELVAATPAILWVAANVHGNEKSGGDAALKVLYELADRTDCAAQTILNNSIVVIMPTQNPDGRVRNIRRNSYGFDMNRDWFARTQPETDGKLQLLRRYPPMLFDDAHEFGYRNYLFPPHADPEYHETPDTAHDWIFDAYSPAIAQAFDDEGLKYHHGPPYDFFASIFGDTVPAVGFHGAGMTFEKNYADPLRDRTFQQFLAMWSSVFQGATGGSNYVRQWHESYVTAYEEGLAGTLEPNAIYHAGNDLFQEVPDITVRHYFLLNEASRRFELETLVRRLQRMDVDVYQLTEPLSVPDFHPYGDPETSTTLPEGTYWIPMAQGQKHWIQSMLHEDTYMPYKVTYDVTAWSNPLLMNLHGGYSGEVLDPAAARVPAIRHDAAWSKRQGAGTVGLYKIPLSTRGWETANQARYLFDKVWHLRYSEVSTRDVKAGLRGIDVLVMPDGYAFYALEALGREGKEALKKWIRNGGRIVTWQDGIRVLVRSGISTVKWGRTNAAAPGSLIRTTVDQSSPLAKGIGPTMWVMYTSDGIVRSRDAVVRFPSTDSPDFATAGKAKRMSMLTGASVVSDEAVGQGRVVSFSIDPNFRAWTLGTERMLWNAITGPDPRPAAAKTAVPDRVAAVAAAKRAERRHRDVGDAIRVAVPRNQASEAQRIIGSLGLKAFQSPLGNEQRLIVVPNVEYLGLEESRQLAQVLPRLKRSGVTVLWASLPGP
ncbi:MAG: M14 family zinc carboxypeptidase [Candidatus Nanopelagicales bacterium]